MNKINWYLDKCRFCFIEIKEDSMLEMDEVVICTISDLFSLELTISPKLSSKICKPCYVKVTEAHQFKQKVIENQNHLNKILLEISDECEVVEHGYEIVFENEEYIEEEDEEVHDDKKLKKLAIKKNESDDICICPDCGKILKGNNHLNFHIKTKHLKLTKFKCDLCGFTSYGKYELKQHLLIQHLPLEVRKTFKCDLCPSVLTTKMSLKTHKMHRHSGLRPHSCSICHKSFSLRETLKSHIRNVHNMERKYKCNDCNKGFNSNPRLNDHINNSHGKKQELPCEKCGKVFNSLRNLQTHSIYHLAPSLKCQFCEKLFYIKKNLKEHQESNHLGITYSCQICQRTFQSTSGLRRHMRTHELLTKNVKIPIFSD